MFYWRFDRFWGSWIINEFGVCCKSIPRKVETIFNIWISLHVIYMYWSFLRYFKMFILSLSALQEISVNVTGGSETLTKGGNLSLLCIASGYPEPTFTWSKSNIVVSSIAWLNFTNIGKNATGEYICKANNTCGEKWSSRRTIDVQCKRSFFFPHLSL